MVSLSKRNKRTSLHKKYKVAKKVREHHREVKKSLKNSKPKKELPIDMQIPMELPFKDKIIKDLNKSKLMEKEAEKKRLAALRILQKTPKVDEFEQLKSNIKDSSRAFIGDIRKLIDESDVILIVLDARDPMGTRSIESEKLIKSANKTIIFVLNKIDLVPTDNMKAWMAYLSKDAKTFPFKASCQEQANRLGSAGGYKPSSDLNGSGASFGVDTLVNYLKSMNKKTSGSGGKSADKLVIGVAGVPNTGKSSVINSIKRKRICEAGNLAGLTRNLQHVALDNHIVLIDSPGIVLAKSSDPAEFALRNCLRVEKIEDPVAVAEAIYKRCHPAQLQFIYKLSAFDDVTEFMLAFATRMCPLKKGGVPNLRLASVKLINDWNRGKIGYCTEPPVSNSGMMGENIDMLTAEDEAAINNVTYQVSDSTIPSIAVLKTGHLSDNLMAVTDGDDVDMDQ